MQTHCADRRTQPHASVVEGIGIKRATAMLLTASLAVAFVLVLPRTASASATGCTTTQFGTLCNDTQGTGLIVDRVRASISDDSWVGVPPTLPQPICNKEFKISGTLPDGSSYERSAVSQCGRVEAYVMIEMNQAFKGGSRLCVAIKEQGDQNLWEPQLACNAINS